ncbi:hypothetical protein ILUMI_02189 [Ignelater luminosus]|uniref:Uncharacterized protein n=1 Tax=Ignelater luminosus TaxID=2038154 RepID=A0A8K0GL18_IGNLU|nr:hypothetical protein ILUMI_02189 [Ignelater luminosus]
MRFLVVFVFALVILSIFTLHTEAAPASSEEEDIWKKLEGVGQRVFKVAKDVLPVAQGYLDVYKGIKQANDDD